MKKIGSAVALFWVLATNLSLANDQIRLKKRTFTPNEDLQAHLVGPLKRRATADSPRSHFLVQFRQSPSPEHLQALGRRGLRVTSWVSENSFVVSAGDGFPWDDAGVRFVGRLEDVDKISPALESGSEPEPDDPDAGAPGAFVVEFHPDVDMDHARELIGEHNLRILDHPDLLPYQLLVEGEQGVVVRLSEWDEVAYIFPASEELVRGEPVRGCAGAITELGAVGQYVKTSNGWSRISDVGPVDLKYMFGALTQKLPESTVRSEIVRAMAEWIKFGNLRFSPGSVALEPRSIYIYFATGNHGDTYNFDGPGKTLAHTFYPAPPNPEPIAGDMHLDADENWNVGSVTDLYSVALHEVGHALGLGHSDRPGAVMYPYYRQATTLASDDIAGIRDLYGAASTDPTTPPPPPPPSPTPTPVPASLTLAITSPTGTAINVTQSSIAFQGTAAGGSGAIRVNWVNDRGGAGAASGPANWSISAIALVAGDNRITITATDEANHTSTQIVVVTRAQSPATDTTAPSIQVTSPASSVTSTSALTITITGTASDNVGVTSVRWTLGSSSGNASGTSSWTASNVPLRVGTNQITIRAYDAAGNSSWRSVTVVRR